MPGHLAPDLPNYFSSFLSKECFLPSGDDVWELGLPRQALSSLVGESFSSWQPLTIVPAGARTELTCEHIPPGTLQACCTGPWQAER